MLRRDQQRLIVVIPTPSEASAVLEATWHWVDASGDPVIINGLAPARPKILIQLVNANHQPIDQGTVQFTMPAAKPRPEAH